MAASCIGGAQSMQVQPSADFGQCMDSAGGNTWAMVGCIEQEASRQDAALNGAYRALMGDLPAERKKRLRAAQRLWIKYRDANCAFYFDPEGGQMAQAAAASCLMDETAHRARELETLNSAL